MRKNAMLKLKQDDNYLITFLHQKVPVASIKIYPGKDEIKLWVRPTKIKYRRTDDLVVRLYGGLVKFIPLFTPLTISKNHGYENK